MTIVNLYPQRAGGNARPTVANPIVRKDAIEKALRGLDEHINLLRCVCDALDKCEPDAVRDEHLDGLETVQKSLRTECDKLCSLL